MLSRYNQIVILAESEVLTMRYDFAGLLQESLNSHTGWGTHIPFGKYTNMICGERKSVQQQVNNGSIITLASAVTMSWAS